MTYAALETRGLTKAFNGCKAVDSLDLKVPEGSVFGFLGPNGAGKTTTIKMITGLSNPSAGEVKICGKTVKFGSSKNRTDIGYLPDVPSYYNWMSAKEFLRFSGGIFSIDKDTLNKRIYELLELVGLKDVKKKIRGFSRGMKQRLGIAQALINAPKLLLLDEPTSALDPIGRKDVLDIISKLSGKTTVFFSTHILTDAERVCDNVAILNKGKLVVEDSMENLRHRYSERRIIIEIEDEAGEGLFIDTLKQNKWVVNAAKGENGEINVVVRDLGKAEKDIPGILYEKGIRLKKFLLQEPSLEDIFLKAVSGE